MTRYILFLLGLSAVVALPALLTPDETYELGSGEHVPSVRVGFEPMDVTPTHPPGVETTTTTQRKVRAASAAPAALPASVRQGLACGGDLPPCYVLARESLMAADPLRVWNGNCYYEPGYAGDNPCGSTASGKWQALRSTWAGFGGYLNAADAPESVQDDFARQLWAGGRGCAHWAAC